MKDDPPPEVPKEMPVLPLQGKVMLPASLLRVRIPAKLRTTYVVSVHYQY